MLAAFLCYTGMYAVRKSFLAGQYTGVEFEGMHFKTILVISQVIGYMLSKFIGIKVISELDNRRRSWYLIGMVGFGLLMLLAFAVLPPNLKPIALFLNGLPLGMVFGIVFSYLEGRRNTELLAAALSATFVFSTGFVKTIGVWLLQDYGIGEFMMPFLTGLLFFPIFILAVWMLNRAKPPGAQDVDHRSERVPMDGRQRAAFLRQHGLGFAGLVLVYILLTVIRDFRDNFIVEFWAELGYAQQPELITLTEIPVAVIVLIIAAAGVLIQSNRRAFNSGMYLIMLCSVLILLVTVLFSNQLISPVIWMIGTGIGVYLPYILFHCLIFERLIALLRFRGNVGFLFYLADALGYSGSVAVMLIKELGGFETTWVHFFIDLNIYAAFGILGIAVLALYLISRKRVPETEVVTMPQSL
ncbi:hypothetical protein CRP01_21515 [Flavilitoribacter nigricans DSM 23189 = NBRC 102662]|uniref:MFS transporter n=2 Tax=Flavilitoribacter TaxID=2762562 RepID=A0A2D0N862_FLAN2|nr:hypothetical protein CRP01_21515 [Flavilitoribacter nigricans DSM 23189 = NBRC 102662]